MRILIVAVAAVLSGCAASAVHAPSISPIGRTFHYERTNIAGGEEEQVYIHRPAIDRVEVYKMVERCTRSAFVTAFIDPRSGVASRLVAARLVPGGPPAQYATLIETNNRLTLTLDMDGEHHTETIPIAMRPWHDYDYDLGTLAAALQARPGRRAGFRFGMTMVGSDPAMPGKLLHWLGMAEARFTRAERHLEADTLRFEVSGPAFGAKGGGPLWVDADDGHIVDVQWGLPNHNGYADFRLRLIAEETAGEEAWAALLKRHYEGCPPAGE